MLTLSGFIKADVIHDFDKIQSPYKFVAKDIVVDGQPSGQPSSRTTFTANASRFIAASATPTDYGKLSTFLSFDFADNTTSSDPDLRFRQGWGQLDDFFWGGALRVGQSWTSWDDLAALPETMDFQGPNGSQQNRQTLVRWARDFQKKYTLWVSVENPDYSITNGKTKSAWPDTIVSLKWHGDWGHLKPALMGRQLRGIVTMAATTMMSLVGEPSWRAFSTCRCWRKRTTLAFKPYMARELAATITTVSMTLFLMAATT